MSMSDAGVVRKLGPEWSKMKRAKMHPVRTWPSVSVPLHEKPHCFAKQRIEQCARRAWQVRLTRDMGRANDAPWADLLSSQMAVSSALVPASVPRISFYPLTWAGFRDRGSQLASLRS